MFDLNEELNLERLCYFYSSFIKLPIKARSLCKSKRL